jgi:hypothetical protein
MHTTRNPHIQHGTYAMRQLILGLCLTAMLVVSFAMSNAFAAGGRMLLLKDTPHNFSCIT